MKLIKFETSHCGMCMAMDKILTDAKIDYIKVNAETNTEAVEEYGIRNVPTLVKQTDDGREIGRCGFMGKEELIKFCKG